MTKNLVGLGARPSQVAQGQRIHLPTQEMQEPRVQSPGREDPPEQEMAIHFSTLAWGIAWIEGPGGLQSIGLQRVRCDRTCFMEEAINPVSQHSVIRPSDLLILGTSCADCDSWSLGSYCSLFLSFFSSFPLVFFHP